MALDYLDFYFDGQKLSDFGGLVAGPNGWNPLSVLPGMDKKSEKVIGRDGQIFYGASYNPRVFSIPVVFENVADLDHIRNVAAWLGVKEPKYFYFVDDDIKIKCMIDTMLNWQHFDLNGIMELRFIAYDPHYYLETDDVFVYTQTQLLSGQTFTAQGNVTAYPRFTIGSYSSPTLTFGSQTFTINGSGAGMIVDCLNKTATDLAGTTNLISQINNAFFPTLTPGSNTVTLTSGTMATISIESKAKYI